MAAHRSNIRGLPFVCIDEDGYLQLYTSEGHRVECNQFLRVTDSLGEPNYAVGKFQVNIVGSKEEMMQEIKKYMPGTAVKEKAGAANNKVQCS